MFFGLTNFKLIAGIIGLIALIGIPSYLTYSYNESQNKLKLAQEEIIKKKTEIENLTQINADNQIQMTKLIESQKLTQEYIEGLRIQKSRDNKKLDELRDKISKMNGTDDGPISNVLKTTIQEIQKGKQNEVHSCYHTYMFRCSRV